MAAPVPAPTALPTLPAPAERWTERLHLRPWRDEDRAPFAALNADPEVMAYFPSTLDRAASDAMVDAVQARFAERGWGNWALARRDGGGFIGFAGLSVPQRVLPFSPCVEVGWRLVRCAWGQGYATEAGREALRFGFEVLGLPEVVSFTTLANQRSRAVMVRLGLTDTGQDFEHPGVPEGHPLRPHCLYRITRAQWQARADGEAEVAQHLQALPAASAQALRAVLATARALAPGATLRLSYGMPTLFQDGVLVHVGAFKRHVGLFPPVADAALAARLARWAGPKGNLRFPLDEPLPLDLIAEVVRARLAVLGHRATGQGARRPV